MRFKRVRTLGWLIAAALPIAACGAALAQDEFAAVLRGRPNMVHGEQLFATCAACHGADGAGVSDGIVPAIAGQHYRVLAGELLDYRHDKRWDIRMEHHADDHNLGDTQDVVDVAGVYQQSEACPHRRSRRRRVCELWRARLCTFMCLLPWSDGRR